MFSTTHRPNHLQTQIQYAYTPSPLSSSPIAATSSPSPLSERCENVPGNLNISFQDRVMDGDGEGMDMGYSPSPKSSSASSKKNSIFTPTQLFSHQSYTTTPTTTSSYSQINSSPTSFDFTNAASNYSPNTTPPTNKDSKFSKRTTKVNGLFAKNGGSREDNRETRRKLFLKRVKQGSEEKRWNDRGGEEEIMRVLWLGEERRRLEGLRAAGVFVGEEEVEELFGEEEEEVDEVARLEELEVEAMIEEMRREQERERAVQFGLGYQNQQQQQQSWNSSQLFNHQGQEREQYLSRPTSMYGSDDDEYDDVFQDVVEEEIRMSQQQSQSQSHSQPQQLQSHPLQNQGRVDDGGEDQDMMDLS